MGRNERRGLSGATSGRRCAGRALGSGALAVLALALAGPGQEVLAQVCAGGVTEEGEYAARGDLNVRNGDTDYGGGVEANFPGRLAAQAGATFSDDRRRLDGQVTYDLTRGQVSVCPVVGAEHRTRTRDEDHGEVDFNQLRVPVGLTVGSRLQVADGASLTPSAEGGAFYDRISQEGALDGDWSDTDTGLFTRAGLTLSVGDAYFRGSVGIDTQTAREDESDLDYRFSAGVRF